MFGRRTPLELVTALTPVHLQDQLHNMVRSMRSSEDPGESMAAELAAVRWLMGLAEAGAVPLRPAEFNKLWAMEQKANPLRSSTTEAMADSIIGLHFPDWQPSHAHPDREDESEPSAEDEWA